MRKAIQMFGLLDDVDIEWMAKVGSSRYVNRGTTLIQQGKQIDSLYILLEGNLSVTTGYPEPREIASLLAGEILGEISFVDSRPPVASVLAVQDAHVLELPRQAIYSRLEKDLGFAARFYRAIASFLADRLYVTVGRFGYGSAQQDVDVDELSDASMDQVSLGALRFDGLMKKVTNSYTAQTTGT
jgi:CRP-like cAMP-binding protein